MAAARWARRHFRGGAGRKAGGGGSGKPRSGFGWVRSDQKIVSLAGSQVAIGSCLCAVGKLGETVEAPEAKPAPAAAKPEAPKQGPVPKPRPRAGARGRASRSQGRAPGRFHGSWSPPSPCRPPPRTRSPGQRPRPHGRVGQRIRVEVHRPLARRATPREGRLMRRAFSLRSGGGRRPEGFCAPVPCPPGGDPFPRPQIASPRRQSVLPRWGCGRGA